MITVQEHPQGATLAIRAQPGARKNAILGEQAGALKVAVTAPPEDGKANAAILDLLRGALQLKRSQLELVSGATHRQKVILIRDRTPEQLQQQLAALLG